MFFIFTNPNFILNNFTRTQPMFLRAILLLLFYIIPVFSNGQIIVENMTKGPKYTTFITLNKNTIKEIIAKNKYKEWETKLNHDGDTLIIDVIEPILVSWENEDIYDTMNVIHHILTFDSSSVCNKDIKEFTFSKNPGYEIGFATRNLSWRWKKSSIKDLYLSKYKFRLSMEIQKPTKQTSLTIIYTLNPNWTKEEYNKHFTKSFP